MAVAECPGCDTYYDHSTICCPGCGRCPVCGTRRAKDENLSCPECGLPFCNECGRYPQCGAARYADIIDPCPKCNHPNDTSEFVQRPWWKRIF